MKNMKKHMVEFWFSAAEVFGRTMGPFEAKWAKSHCNHALRPRTNMDFRSMQTPNSRFQNIQKILNNIYSHENVKKKKQSPKLSSTKNKKKRIEDLWFERFPFKYGTSDVSVLVFFAQMQIRWCARFIFWVFIWHDTHLQTPVNIRS